MEKIENNTVDYDTLDVPRLLKFLIKRAWIIVLGGVLTAFIGFSISAFVIPPAYSSHIKIYVYNSTSPSDTAITKTDIDAAKSLVKTYGAILDSRTTLETVIEKANLSYAWKDLRSMITHHSSDDTEIMTVIVTSKDPYEACEIANTIAEVLPTRITEIVNGTSMKIVDYAVPDTKKVSPSISKNTIVGFGIGIALSVAVIFVLSPECEFGKKASNK